MTQAPELTAERLRELMRYDPATGLFWWRPPGRRKPLEKPAGAADPPHKYVRIGIDGRHYRAHRLAWLYVYGRWPNPGIDHINGDQSDNRIANLREAAQWQNAANRGVPRNNKSGLKGIYPIRDGRWRAQIGGRGKKRHLGLFDTLQEAHQAYVLAAQEMYGDFARS